ncbi:MAG: YdeI/OmpD-associated family protein [Mucilaginibacter sp.]|nr:YdeI/OmpD-associated family protein [Mucilaginibacter sp.]
MSVLAKKLLIKPGKRWLFYNAPKSYFAILDPLPEGVTLFFNPSRQFDGVQLFVKDAADLAESLKSIVPVLKPDTVFWITYPKKSSGIKSDLEMMGSWDEVAKYGLRIVASAAIDETWTALRFRPEAQVKTSDGRNDTVRQNEYSAYIDVDNKQIKLPPIIADALKAEPRAMDFYQQLSYSNKKEYVLWILTAKQEKTRDERLIKLVEKLNDGKKNPSEK